MPLQKTSALLMEVFIKYSPPICQVANFQSKQPENAMGIKEVIIQRAIIFFRRLAVA